MIISDITDFKGQMKCVEIGGMAQEMKIYIHRDVLADESVYKGMEISGEEIDRLIYLNDYHRAKERALYLLDERDYSYSGLFDKLEKNYSEEICFEVCGRMKELGFINDRRYAENLCRRLAEVKKYGPYRIKQEMRMKGVPSDIISEVMEEYAEEDTESSDRLYEIVERKYARYLTDRKGVQKVTNALVRLGYSYGQIREVLEEYDTDINEYE